jgi:hypothetical protein
VPSPTNPNMSYVMSETDNREYPAAMVVGWPERMAAAQQVTTLVLNGVELLRVAYGSENGLAVPKQLCHDCLVENGHYHVLGCDVEECPSCAGQLISCGCW